MEIITSTANQIVKKIRSLQEKKGRALANAFLVEGAKFVAEIGGGWDVQHVVVSQSFAEGASIIPQHALVVSDRVFAGVSDVASPQGILAVVGMRNFTIRDVCKDEEHPVIMLLDGINDPGNLGTILRNCHGLGVSGIVLSPNCTDIFSPKVIRASAGSIFHIPFAIMELSEAVKELQIKGIPIYGAAAGGQRSVYELDLQSCAAFVLGNEHHGITPQIFNMVDEAVKIPAVSESLNVSVACAIMAYEVLRQRNIN